MSDPKNIDAAIAQVQQISPDAAKTLRSMADAQAGNFAGAQATLNAENAPHTGNPTIDAWITNHKSTAQAAMGTGDRATAVADEKEVFNGQMVADAAYKLFDATFVHPNAQQADAVRNAMRSFAGDKAAEELDKLNAANFAAVTDKYTGKNPAYDQQEQFKHAYALGDALKAAVDNAITGGEPQQGAPRSQATPAVPGTPSGGRGGPN
jgi:hypothetical protein